VADIAVHLHDKRVLRPVAKLEDRPTDLAVLLLGERDLTAARLGDSETLEIGHLVLAMGSPFGLSQSTTLGIISAKGRRALRISETTDILNQDFLQTDAAINPGNSGGPLIDMYGSVVGINSAIASNSGGNEGIGFSIPSALVRTVVEQLLTTGRVVRAYLGVSLDPDFNVDAASALKLDRVRGARVLRVNPDTPADRAQMRIDDVVLTYDGTEVQDENHLINMVSLTPWDAGYAWWSSGRGST
jgi:serine protease Do